MSGKGLANADHAAKSGAADPNRKKRSRGSQDAFTQLMHHAKKPAVAPAPASSGPSTRYFPGSDGLGVYIAHPEAYLLQDASAADAQHGGRVIFYTDAFVAIHDLYPKSTVHCLLLPRHPTLNRLHPLELLSRADDKLAMQFLEELREAAERLREIVAAELRRLLGSGSAQDAAREAFLRGDNDDGDDGDDNMDDGMAANPPPGRDWKAEVLVGVHASPSMRHIHVHVLSPDMHSDRMRNLHHYNSFTTPFFVPLTAFPLAADDSRRTGAAHVYLNGNMTCWRCGREFGRRFAELKRHLDGEFAAWKKL